MMKIHLAAVAAITIAWIHQSSWANGGKVPNGSSSTVCLPSTLLRTQSIIPSLKSTASRLVIQTSTTSPHTWTCFMGLWMQIEAWLGLTGLEVDHILRDMEERVSPKDSFSRLGIMGLLARIIRSQPRSVTCLPGSLLPVHWNLYSTCRQHWWNFELFMPVALYWDGLDRG